MFHLAIIGSNQSCAQATETTNPQETESFDRLLAKVIRSFDEMITECSKTENIEAVKQAAVQCMTKTQGGSRHLMRQVMCKLLGAYFRPQFVGLGYF